MSNVMFYEKPVAVHRDQHRSTLIGQVTSLSFAAKTNSVFLNGVEFIEACKEYPIVFAAIGGRKVPVALVGLRDNENLFVQADGSWDARYIPAFVRRYPFVLAEGAGDQLVVCIDEASTAFNAKDGQPLFDQNGANTPFLDNALNFVNAYQAQTKRTEEFVNKLDARGLFKEMSSKTELTDGRNFVLNGIYVIDEEKLMSASDQETAEMFKSGEAGWVFAHLISLSNMGRLVDRISKKT